MTTSDPNPDFSLFPPEFRRRVARRVVGLSEGSDDTMGDHQKVCMQLQDSGFLPVPGFIPAATILCTTKLVFDKPVEKFCETLAKDALSQFSKRYFFLDSAERTKLWHQLTDIVCHFPALAWRHRHLKAGLHLRRDVLRPLGDRVQLAAFVIQSYVESPTEAAESLREAAHGFARDAIEVERFWIQWHALRNGVPEVALLTPAGVDSIHSRMRRNTDSKMMMDRGLTSGEMTDADRGNKKRSILASWQLKCIILIGSGAFFLSEVMFGWFDTTPTIQSRPDSISSSKSADSEVSDGNNGRFDFHPEHDRVKGELIIQLLRKIELHRRQQATAAAISNDGSGTHDYQRRLLAAIDDQRGELLRMRAWDLIVKNDFNRTNSRSEILRATECALVLPKSLSTFRCVGFGRSDIKQTIYGAFWTEKRVQIDQDSAISIHKEFNGKALLGPDQMQALQQELEALLGMRVFVLTPDLFLQSCQVEGITARDAMVPADSDRKTLSPKN